MVVNTRAIRFAEVYDGNGVQAARAAGYKGSDAVLATTAGRLLRNPEVLERISKRETKRITGKILTREERQAFWSTVANDENADMGDRLRASELLGKSQADFIERTRLEGAGGTPAPAIVALAAMTKDQLAAIVEATK